MAFDQYDFSVSLGKWVEDGGRVARAIDKFDKSITNNEFDLAEVYPRLEAAELAGFEDVAMALRYRS